MDEIDMVNDADMEMETHNNMHTLYSDCRLVNYVSALGSVCLNMALWTFWLRETG